jgi:hypothetical protein
LARCRRMTWRSGLNFADNGMKKISNWRHLAVK